MQIIDEAFEYLITKSAKGEKGQYFTPRHVIDMCVKMLNPKAGEYMVALPPVLADFPCIRFFKSRAIYSKTLIFQKKKKK